MSAAASPFNSNLNSQHLADQRLADQLRAEQRKALDRVRVVGGLAIEARRGALETDLMSLHEFGGYRVKSPERRDGVLEAVTINTGGGVAGGDQIGVSARATAGARLTLTSATAERIYRTHGPATSIAVSLDAEADATLAWLPQASIIFSGASLQRKIDVTCAGTSRIVVGETTIFGRGASGEVFSAARLRDRWQVWRGGRLVFVEAAKCDRLEASLLARDAVAGGASIAALLIALAPDIEERRDAARQAITDAGAVGGVSAWNGMLVARLFGDRLDRMAVAMRSLVTALDIIPLPTAWTH